MSVVPSLYTVITNHTQNISAVSSEGEERRRVIEEGAWCNSDTHALPVEAPKFNPRVLTVLRQQVIWKSPLAREP